MMFLFDRRNSGRRVISGRGSRRPDRRRFRPRTERLEARRLLAAEIEPNDDLASATALTAGDLLEGRVSRITDVDFFRTTLNQGEHFSINTFNVNAPRFDPTLPPGIEILDSSGNTLSTSFDGRVVGLVAPSTGEYLVRITAGNAFGTFVGDYGMQSSLVAAPGDAEAEPNDDITDAQVAALGRPFAGSLSSGTDVDVFRVDAQQGDSVVIAFAGLAQNNPAVEITTSTGMLLGQDLAGNGLAVEIDRAQSVYIQLSDNNPSGSAQGEYVAVINRFDDTRLADEGGNDLDQAEPFDTAAQSETVTGSLDTLSDSDFYRFEVDALEFLAFDLQLSGRERIVDSGKEMRLYNQYGQFLESSTGGFLNIERNDALTPGTYFLEVLAASPVGTGAYALSYTTRTDFSLQRDNALHFMDFDSTDPYLGFDRVNPYADPAGIPYYVGLFESRFEPYDVEVTLNKPVEGTERVASGIGDFGDIGAGGFGGGSRGVRSSQGNTVNSAREPVVDFLSYYSAATVMHEFGHATGLPHARDVQALMSYVGSAEYLPVGDTFPFQGTDSRRPGNSVYDVRNYLDWALQPGAQVYVSETEDSSSGGGVELAPFFREMSLDHEPVSVHDTGESPFFAVTGDFNNDDRPDVAVASHVDDQISIFLTNALGTFDAPMTVNIGGNVEWWTEALEVGDFDRDGDDDLAVAVFGERRISVFSSNGDGTFAAAVNYGLTSGPQGIVSTDVDGNGILDLVAVVGGGSRAQVLLGNSDGTFTADVGYTTGLNPYSVTAGDFDGDGNIDLATANLGADTVTLLRGTGGGAFSPNGTLFAGTRPESVTSADFNGDGLADLAVANRGDRNVEIFLSSNGTLESHATIPLRVNPRFLRAVDVNGDGNQDLVSSGFGSALQVLLDEGGGDFSRAISMQSGNSESQAAVADFDNDGRMEFAIPNDRGDTLTLVDERADNPRNDRVVVYGAIDTDNDVDRYIVDVSAGQRMTFDIDSAEFQYPLDATLTILDSLGQPIASSDNAMDRNSGITSVDPFVDIVFESPDRVTIEVAGKLGSVGDYRFKVTPERALDQDGPRVVAVFPDNGALVDSTQELVFFMNDLIDPATLTGANLTVVGANNGAQAGVATINPLDSTVIWRANAPLPFDTYTITLNGNVGGLADFAGNVLDGEVAVDFAFPDQSGDGSPGGSFVSTVTVVAPDLAPAQVFDISYLRDPYNRGRFQLNLTDQLSIVDTHSADFQLRSAGPDGQFDTTDDTLQPLDPVYETLRQTRFGSLNLYSRGIPDSGVYRVEGNVLDAAGHLVRLSESISVSGSVPESALFTDAALTSSGLTGSYVNQSLRSYPLLDDWRVSQTISGTRVDPQVAFSDAEFGDRASVGITGGVDDSNWDNFSAQWDGWIVIPEDGVRLLTRSDDGSRMLVDLNGNGTFESSTELFNNGWGFGHRLLPGQLTPPLQAGAYQIRLQYEEGLGGEQMHLEWIRPGTPVDVDGYIHGPSITEVSVAPGAHLVSSVPDEIVVTFSGSLNPATLTTENLNLRYSQDPTFFDGNDQILNDSDGLIQWDPTTLQATLDFGTQLENGFYLLEANGDVGGIANPAGDLLDGEYLSTMIHGNTSPFIWDHTPSGNGIAGGDFRSTFDVAQPALEVDIADARISENGGQTVATITRRFADLSVPLQVTLTLSDPSELTASVTNIVIPVGLESVSVNLFGVDDTFKDGDQPVQVSATASGLAPDEATVIVEDFESLILSLSADSLSEKDGTTEVTIMRLDPTGVLSVRLEVDRPDKASVIDSVTMVDGQSTTTVTIAGVDNALLDGTQLVTLVARAQGLIDAPISFDVLDHEELTLEIVEDVISERNGTSTAVIRRTDPRGDLVATLAASPGGLVSLPLTVRFVDGLTTSTSFEVSAIDNQQLDVTRTATVTAQVPGYIDATDTIDVTDFEELTLVLDQTTLSEADGVATARVVRTDPTGEATVSLVVDDPSRLSVPTTINIADGEQSSAPFAISAIDNQTIDGDQIVNILATLTGYEPASIAVTVLDFEPLGLSVLDEPIFENDGQARFQITRTDTTQSVTIDLSGTAVVPVSLPLQVTMPQGVDTVEFVGTIRDNDKVGADQQLTLGAASAGYVPDSIEFTLFEDDVPELVLQFDQSQLIEGGEQITATLTRNTTPELVVRLDATPSGELDFPSTVQFGADQSTVEFRLAIDDNLFVDGSRSIRLRASADGHPAVTSNLEVLDDDRARFRFVSEEISIAESGDDQTASIVLDAAPLSDVEILVSSSDPAQLTVDPATLVFTRDTWDRPQSVTVSAIDDVTVESPLNLSLVASVVASQSDAAFASAPDRSLAVLLTDNDSPGIEIQDTDGSTIVSELGLEDQFMLNLSTRPTSPVTLVVDGSELPEVVFTPASLTFTPQNWDQPQVVAASTPLDFDEDGNSVGLVYVSVDPSTSNELFAAAPHRAIAVIHVDSVLNQLRIGREDDSIVLVDEFSGQTLQSTPADNPDALTLGSRGETVTVQSGVDNTALDVDTAGGDDAVRLDTYVLGNVDTGDGFDTIVPLLVDQMLDLASPSGVQLRNIERVDLTTDGPHALSLSEAKVLGATDAANVLAVEATGADDVEFDDGWQAQPPIDVQGKATHVLVKGAAVVQLSNDSIWQNPLLAQDVDRGGAVTSRDALLIVNWLAASDSSELPPMPDADDYYLDVNGDGEATALDALQVINRVSQEPANGAGEAELASGLTGLPRPGKTSEKSGTIGPAEIGGLEPVQITRVGSWPNDQAWSSEAVDLAVSTMSDPVEEDEAETPIDGIVGSLF